MTAPNHALTGALIGLSIANPAIALPLAFLSHFICDAIPHWDPKGNSHEERMNSRQFLWVQLISGAVLCFIIVIALALTQPRNWLLAAMCAFVAACPDLFFLERFVHVKRTGKDILEKHWFWRFHNGIGKVTGPKFAIVELLWFMVFGSLVLARL